MLEQVCYAQSDSIGYPGMCDENHLRVVFVCPDHWSGVPFRGYEERYT